MAKRLARLDKFCEGMEDELQWELLEPAHRYTRGEITFEKFEEIARKFMCEREAARSLAALEGTMPDLEYVRRDHHDELEKLAKNKHGFPVVKGSGPVITSEMVKIESEDNIDDGSGGQNPNEHKS